MLNALTGSDLVRNQKIEYRKQYREEKMNNLLKDGKNTESLVIIVMEYMKEMKWKNTCVVARKNWPAHRLISYAKKFSDHAGEGISLAPPKQGVIIQGNRLISELY